MMCEASRKQRDPTGYFTPSLARGLAQGCQSKTVACSSSFAFSTILYPFSLKPRHICIIDDDFNLFLCFVSCNPGFFLIAEWQAPPKKQPRNGKISSNDLGTSGSEAGTPKRGRKKKGRADPGLTMGTDIEDHLKPDGRQVEVELNNVRIDQEK